MKMTMKIMMKTMTMNDISNWSQRLAANSWDLDEVDRLIRNYNSKYFGSSEEDFKKPETHMALSGLANDVTKAAVVHAKRGRKYFWNVAKNYSKKSKDHEKQAKQLEYGVQDTLF